MEPGAAIAGEPRGERFDCPACSAAFYYLPPGRRKIFCTCGYEFIDAVNIYEVTEEQAPWESRSRRPAPAVAPVAPPAVAARVAVVRAVENDSARTKDPARPKDIAQTASLPMDAPAAAEMRSPLPEIIPSAQPISLETLYGTRPRHQVAVEAAADSLWRDGVLPTALCTGSIVLWLARATAAPVATLSRGQSVVLALCQMVVAMALALAGGALMTRVVETEIGSAGRAIFKLIAIALTACAVAALTVSLAGAHARLYGAMLAVPEMLLVYAALIWALFRFDLQECLMCSAVLVLLEVGGAVALSQL